MLPAATPVALAEVSAREAWVWFQGAPIRILATIVLAVVARWVLHRITGRTIAVAIERGDRADRSRTGWALAHAAGWSADRHRQRLATLGSLLRSVVTFVIALIAVLTVMSLLGIPLAPLLASAGVGGLALGFGAQALVKDFLSGIFMIMEDQYGVGDVVDLGEVVGTVEEVSLRITTLRDATGVTWHVRNGEVLRVGNKSQSSAQAVVDLPVAYEADLESALAALAGAADAFHADPVWRPRLLERPQVLGVEAIAGGVVTLRMLAKCIAGEDFAVQRALRLRGKEALDKAGVPGAPGPGSAAYGEPA